MSKDIFTDGNELSHNWLSSLGQYGLWRDIFTQNIQKKKVVFILMLYRLYLIWFYY